MAQPREDFPHSFPCKSCRKGRDGAVLSWAFQHLWCSSSTSGTWWDTSPWFTSLPLPLFPVTSAHPHPQGLHFQPLSPRGIPGCFGLTFTDQFPPPGMSRNSFPQILLRIPVPGDTGQPQGQDLWENPLSRCIFLWERDPGGATETPAVICPFSMEQCQEIPWNGLGWKKP